MSSQTVSRRLRPRRQPGQKRTQGATESSHTGKDQETMHNDGVDNALTPGGVSMHSSPRRRLVSHHISPRRKLERSPVRKAHLAMPKPPLHRSLSPPPSQSPKVSPKTRPKGSCEIPRELDTTSQSTPSRPKVRRRPAIGKLTIRIEHLKAENLMPVTYQVPLEIKTDSVKHMGETLVNTFKQPTNLTRALLKAPDALLKTSANVVSKTSDALKKSADAFVQVHYFDYGWKSGPKTSIQRRTCSPEWPEVLELQLGADAAKALLKSGERLELRLWNHDVVVGDSFLGSVQIPVLSEDKNKTTYRVLKRSPNDSSLQSHNATGEMNAHVSLHAEAMVDLNRGDSFPLEQSKLTLGVSCRKSHLESSVVVLDRGGHVMWNECAYNDNCVTDSVTISYNDSESKNLLYYHMDRCTIDLDLQTLPTEAVALFLVAYVPSDDASPQLRILETESKVAVARYAPRSVKEPHSVILARLTRHSQGWFVTPIGESFPRVNDFGSLLPVLNQFVQDLSTVPSSHDNSVSATAVICRQRPICLSNDTEQWKLCISWNEKAKDGDAVVHFSNTAFLLDGDFHIMDQVDATGDSSRRGGVMYERGWRPKRSENFEDFLVDKIEAINIQDKNIAMNDLADEFVLNFSKLSERVRHVCFNITLPVKANQVDASVIEKVTLQLHDAMSHNEFARFASPVESESGLLLACFSRRDKDLQGSWAFEVASVAIRPSDIGKQWKRFLTETKHPNPYYFEEVNLKSRIMPAVTVVDAKPITILDDKLLQCLA